MLNANVGSGKDGKDTPSGQNAPNIDIPDPTGGHGQPQSTR